MWIFLNNAFVSAVQHNDDKDLLVVRARGEGELEKFFSDYPEVHSKVERHEDRDYLFRAIVPKSLFAAQLTVNALGIDYGNFKDSIGDDLYHSACNRVWGAMNDYQGKKHGAGKYVY